MLWKKSLAVGLGVIQFALGISVAHADDWLPVSQDELQMTSEPKAPAAAAIILYRQVDRNDNEPSERVYERIKILTDEGRKYADIEIPFNRPYEAVRSIEARTIHPDGRIAEFNGTIYEKPIVKGRGIKLLAKTFTLPDVKVGSIIEYRYRHSMRSGYVYDSHWVLTQDLFIKYAKYSLVPYGGFNMRYSWPIGLPAGTTGPKKERDTIRLETHDVPAFVSEDHIPPEEELKYRVDFIYSTDVVLDKDPAAFWKRVGKDRFKKIESFIDKRRTMEEALSTIVAPGDSPEIKLRKIYTRTQQLRNLSFERAKTEEEIKREGIEDAKNVADVWKKGYGDGLEVTWLFLGLARAAGFQADPVLVSTRDTYFFNERMMNPYQLNTNVVVVKLDDKEIYLDPGTAYAPFGVLPWSETGVKGLRLDKNGGTWVNTPLPQPSDSQTLRKAAFRLDTTGTLEGDVTVTYTGAEALWRRQSMRNEDETQRREYLENELKGDVPSGIDVTVSKAPDWSSSENPLVVEYKVKIPGWANGMGQRALMPVGVFSRGERGTFKHASRTHPIYFSFPYQSKDEITVELPAGWQASGIPQPHRSDQRVALFDAKVEQVGPSTLRITREFLINLLVVDKKYYSGLRDFFEQARTADEEQIVLGPSKAAAPNATPARKK